MLGSSFGNRGRPISNNVSNSAINPIEILKRLRDTGEIFVPLRLKRITTKAQVMAFTIAIVSPKYSHGEDGFIRGTIAFQM